MFRHELLSGLHERLRPDRYLEIGVSTGASMSLSRTCSIGVDPFFNVKHEQRCDLHLVRASSDEFFTRPEPFAHFDQPHPDLVFIDGMHLAEYALRDFINVERHSHPGTVVVLDDMLPKHPDHAARDRAIGRARGAWAGDVYKLAEALRRLRPDLLCIPVDTAPTGTMVVTGLDARSRVLLDAYDDLAESYVSQSHTVPQSVLERTEAVDPAVVLGLDLWAVIVELREAETSGGALRAAITEARAVTT